MTASGGPPPSPAGSRVSALPATTKKKPSISSDPTQLLDAFDAFTSTNRRNSEASDAIEFLNEHYNSEALLVTQLPFIREAVSDRMYRLDDHISTALQRQSDSAEATQKHVQDAKASVASLEQRIRQVQQKASQSEKTVREITKDMKRLDCAKRNLQRTITTLKRLHMLVHAVEQLRLACLMQPFPDYKTSSHLVDAIRLLLNHFEPYKQKVEPIRLLSQKVTDLQAELKFCLVRGFRVVNFGVEKTRTMEKKNKYKSLMTPEEGKDFDDEDYEPDIMTKEVMIGGIMMIDALGIDARKEFMTGFCQDQLLEYTQMYKPIKKVELEKPRVSSFKAQPELPKEDAKPEFALEFVEKRFVWFRNRLVEIGQCYPGVFPSYWNLEYWLTKVFLKRTRNHLLALLGGQTTKDPDAANATVLLKALQKTIQFEKEVGTELERAYGTIFNDPGEKEKNKRAQGQTRKKDSWTSSNDGSKNDQSEEGGNASTEQDPVDRLVGVASSAFDNYMRPYITLEEQQMDEQLVMALEDRTVDTRGELPVFTTSTKLFVYIKGSITRCTALTKGNAFFLLYQAFQNSLRKYAQVLSSKLPPPLPQASSVGGLSMTNVSFGKKEGMPAQKASYRVPAGEEVTVCHIIGTCEYCADTVEALEDLIRDTVDERYKSKIDMVGQQEAFHDITAKAIRVLVTGLENRLEEPFTLMLSVNWATFEEVGEESDYVRYMNKEIAPYITMARSLIPTSYFRSVCDKFALSFTEAYLNALASRVKKVSEPGTQQLLLDVYNLKTLFLKLPVLEKTESSLVSPAARKGLPAKATIPPAMYTKMVQKQFKKIECLLKVAGTPVDLIIDVFKVHWVGGSALDLQMAMSLKGMKRSEQATMLQKFGLDPATARKGATMNVTSSTIVTERLQAVNSDLSQMRKKVDDFRMSFR